MLFKVKNLMKLRKISLLCLFLCIPINFIGAFFSIKFLVIIGVSLLFIFLAISFIFWKCPFCKERLPLRFNPNTDIDDIYRCPYCKQKF
jgi:hypothetical protein